MNNSFKELINGPVPVLVDFSAEWCGPCKMMEPVLKQLKDKLGDRIRIIKVDVDRNSELAAKYRIRSVPSLLLFRNGDAIWSGSGVMTSSYLENVINSNYTVMAD